MEHNLVIHKANLKRVTAKNRTLSTKDMRRMKVSILVVFRMGCVFYFRFLMVQDVFILFRNKMAACRYPYFDCNYSCNLLKAKYSLAFVEGRIILVQSTYKTLCN